MLCQANAKIYFSPIYLLLISLSSRYNNKKKNKNKALYSFHNVHMRSALLCFFFCCCCLLFLAKSERLQLQKQLRPGAYYPVEI